jgi:atypical dual specificity phosphatase
VAHNFSWIFEGKLAGMGRPGCSLELTPEMMSHERRFLAWLNSSSSLSIDRQRLAKSLGLGPSSLQADQRILDLYKKFRDIWGILDSYREGFGSEGEAADLFVRSRKPLEADLAFLSKQGIDSVVSLTESPLDDEPLAAHGIENLHIPIPDRKAPTPEQVELFLSHVDQKLTGGHTVLAHCLGGYGRTGTMLACYLVHCGMPAEQALEGIREKRPGSVESEEQEVAIFEFEERSR